MALQYCKYYLQGIVSILVHICSKFKTGYYWVWHSYLYTDTQSDLVIKLHGTQLTSHNMVFHHVTLAAARLRISWKER